jgi:Domain of unknown function (DUF4383)
MYDTTKRRAQTAIALSLSEVAKMATDVARGAPRGTDDWTPPRIFLAASAGYHFLLAVAGFVIDQTFPVGSTSTAHAGSGHVFGIFETNGWHSLAGFLLGMVSLYFAARPARAREAALGIGLSQLGVVVAFTFFEPSTFWFASNGADQVVHSITAIGGIGSALLVRPTRSRKSASA